LTVVLVDIGDIPDTIRLCRSLQIVDLSSNPLQRFVARCIWRCRVCVSENGNL